MRASSLIIVHVVFSSSIGSVEQQCVDLAHAQSAMGHEVHVIGPGRSAIAGVLEPGVRYHGIALPLLRGLRLRRLVKRLGAQVCHAHLGPACRATAQTVACARVGTLHVGYKPHQHAQLDGLICVNRQQTPLLGDYDGEHRMIHNWAPERRTTPATRSLREELGLNREQLLVGSVGRLHASKGMDLLISAFKDQAPQDAALVIFGEGEDRRELERVIDSDPRIHLLEMRYAIDAALQQMDLFVSPSREEAFSLAILKAMRAGLPIISTATQSSLEMLTGQPATLVPVANAEAMGQALKNGMAALRNTPRAERPRIEYDLQAYDRTRLVNEVLSFYGDLLVRCSGAIAPESTPIRPAALNP